MKNITIKSHNKMANLIVSVLCNFLELVTVTCIWYVLLGGSEREVIINLVLVLYF